MRKNKLDYIILRKQNTLRFFKKDNPIPYVNIKVDRAPYEMAFFNLSTYLANQKIKTSFGLQDFEVPYISFDSLLPILEVINKLIDYDGKFIETSLIRILQKVYDARKPTTLVVAFRIVYKEIKRINNSCRLYKCVG